MHAGIGRQRACVSVTCLSTALSEPCAASRELRESRICSTGWPSQPVLPAFDLFVLPSRNEGMGRALVEAMACGRPVAASAGGGIPEVIEEGRCGLLIPPRDPHAISLAIARVLEDAVFARTLSARARARAISFGAGRMNRALLKLYREVTS